MCVAKDTNKVRYRCALLKCAHLNGACGYFCSTDRVGWVMTLIHPVADRCVLIDCFSEG